MKIIPELARIVLEENPNIPREHAVYFEAARDGNLPGHYLKRLQMLRYDYSDDLPGLDISPDHPDYKERRFETTSNHPAYPRLKCRGNVICGISVTLQSAVEDEVIRNQQITELIESFRKRNWNFTRGRIYEFWTLPEEIEVINRTLDAVINHIKSNYSL